MVYSQNELLRVRSRTWESFNLFLVATEELNKSVCWLVGWLVKHLE